MSLQLPPDPAPSAAPGFPVYTPNAQDGTAMRFAPDPPPQPQPTQLQDPLAEVNKVAEQNPDKVERELLFTIGGTPFYIPKEIDPQLTFKLMRDLKRLGPVMAFATIIEELMGPECLDALADAPGMSKDDWDVIFGILQKKLFSSMETVGKH